MYFERIPRGVLVDWWLSDGEPKETWQAAGNRPTACGNREGVICVEQWRVSEESSPLFMKKNIERTKMLTGLGLL